VLINHQPLSRKWFNTENSILRQILFGLFLKQKELGNIPDLGQAKPAAQPLEWCL